MNLLRGACGSRFDLLAGCLLTAAFVLAVPAYGQRPGDINAAVADFNAQRPLPGLPSLKKPVYLTANSKVCDSPDSYANPNTAITVMVGACAIVPRKIQVMVYPPTDRENYVRGHVFGMVLVGLRSGEPSDGNMYRGWVSTSSLSH
jgi:hypothetical protein